MYIYQCWKKDEKYIPAVLTIVMEKPTQTEAIQWLENNGGGIYRDILCNVEMSVKAKGEK